MSAVKVKTIIAPGTPAGTQTLVAVLANQGVPADARVIYRGRNLIAAAPLLGGTEVNVKSFHVPHLLNRCIYGWWRGSKANRSFHNALRLLNLGIDTPTPYACIEEYTCGGLLRRSYFVSRQLPDGFTDVRYVDRRPDFEELVSALAAFVARLHRKGVWMKDLSPGNVMVRRSDGDGGKARYHFVLVDINRMDFGVSHLDKLVRSCGTLLDSEEALVFFSGAYARQLGIDGAHAADLILTRYRKVNKYGLKRRIKTYLRERRNKN